MSTHEKIVTATLERLLANQSYDLVIADVPYQGWNGAGQLDILTIRDEYAHYYEIKSHFTDAATKKAVQQFERVQKNFPGQKWKYILVTPELVCQVRIPYSFVHHRYPRFVDVLSKLGIFGGGNAND